MLFRVCGCVRRQLSKNARWEAGPYFQAVDGKQPLGSAGLKQLEKFVEGSSARAAQRLGLGSLQEKANPNKPSAAETKQMLLVTASLESNRDVSVSY